MAARRFEDFGHWQTRKRCSRNRRPDNRNRLCPRPAAEADEPRYTFAPTDPPNPARPKLRGCSRVPRKLAWLGLPCKTLPPGFFFFSPSSGESPSQLALVFVLALCWYAGGALQHCTSRATLYIPALSILPSCGRTVDDAARAANDDAPAPPRAPPGWHSTSSIRRHPTGPRRATRGGSDAPPGARADRRRANAVP